MSSPAIAVTIGGCSPRARDRDLSCRRSDVFGHCLAPGGHMTIGRLCSTPSPPGKRARAGCTWTINPFTGRPVFSRPARIFMATGGTQWGSYPGSVALAVGEVLFCRLNKFTLVYFSLPAKPWMELLACSSACSSSAGHSSSDFGNSFSVRLPYIWEVFMGPCW